MKEVIFRLIAIYLHFALLSCEHPAFMLVFAAIV